MVSLFYAEQLILQNFSKYPLPAWFAGLLFLGVVLWQGLSALLFWYAFSAFHGMHFPRKAD